MRDLIVLEKKKVFAEKLILAISFSLLLALLSQIRIPLPFTPVPLTLQTLGVLFIGYFLGAKLGLFSVTVYLIFGGLGLPFFSGLKGGLTVLTGPTGGYLIGFAFAVYLIGLAKERGLLSSWFGTFLIGLFAHLIIYAFGALWFYSGFMQFSPYKTFAELFKFTVYPFIPVDILKSAIFASAIFLHNRIRG